MTINEVQNIVNTNQERADKLGMVSAVIFRKCPINGYIDSVNMLCDDKPTLGWSVSHVTSILMDAKMPYALYLGHELNEVYGDIIFER